LKKKSKFEKFVMALKILRLLGGTNWSRM